MAPMKIVLMFHNFDKIKTNQGKYIATNPKHCNKLNVKLFQIKVRNCRQLTKA